MWQTVALIQTDRKITISALTQNPQSGTASVNATLDYTMFNAFRCPERHSVDRVRAHARVAAVASLEGED